MEGFIPYCRHLTGEDEIAAAIDVLSGGWIARGPKAGEFEGAFARRLRAPHAVSCGNGSAALEIALRAAGVGPGDEVIVPTLTWVATAMAVRLVGATPRFGDIDARSFNLCPRAGEKLFNEKTKAVIAVDFAGVPHDAAAWRELCDTHDAVLIEDAAHALGARYPGGAPVGSGHLADITTFSFHPAKTLTCGEGGLLTTRNEELAERMRRIRSGGIHRDFAGSRGPWDYEASELGSNHHLTEIQAAIGLAQLDRLDEFLSLRAQAAANMDRLLEPLEGAVRRPVHPAGSCHNLYIVQLEGESVDRDRVVEGMRDRGVGAHVHYPLLHRQPIFADCGTTDEDVPNAVRYLERSLTLPHFPAITPADQRYVVAVLGSMVEPAETVALGNS